MLCPVANAAQSGAEPYAGELIENLVVTGTRIKRRDAISVSPLVTLSEDNILLAVQPTLEETLNRLPQLTGDFNRTSNNPGDGTARVNLRGLGSERSLVLLNSRRVAPSGVGSSVDLNIIPQILVDRVEVITGGATAVYGSDALAGVVNFITKDDLDGILLESRYGSTQEGDADYFDVNAAWGIPLADRGNLTVFAGVYDRDALLASARRSTSQALQESGTGSLFAAGSFATPETAIFTPVPGFGFPTFNADGTPRPFVNPQDQYNFAPQTYLQTPLERYSGGMLGQYRIGQNSRLYWEASYTDTRAGLENAPVPAVEFVQVNTDNPVLTPATRQLFIDNYANPSSSMPDLVGFTIGRRFSELGPRTEEFERTHLRTLAGIEVQLQGGWSLDAWLSYSRSDTDRFLLNDASAARLRQGLLVDPGTGECFDTTGGCVPIDLFGPGRISSAAVDFLRYQPLRNVTEREQQQVGAFVSGSAFNSWAGPVDLVFGLEWRRDKVAFLADAALFTGDTLGYNGDAPISGTDEVSEFYLEAVVPLLGDYEAQSLDLELGARYSDYKNAGGAWTYKAGWSWQFAPAWRFRSMWQRSIRAPSNQELYQAQFSTVSNFVGNFVAVDPCSASQNPVGAGLSEICVAQGLAPDQVGVFEAVPFLPVEFVRGGNPDLEPEEGKTWTSGVVYSPLTPNDDMQVSVALDFFDIEITDSIGAISARDICFDPANTAGVFCDVIQRVSDSNDTLVGNVFQVTELFNNRGMIATQGVDLHFDFTTSVPSIFTFGESEAVLRGSLIWTHVLELDFQNNPVGTVESCAGYFSAPCSGVTSSSTSARNRALADLSYTSGPVQVVVGARWIDSTSSYRFARARLNESALPVLARPVVGSQFLVDLAVGYRLGNNLDIRFSVNNLFDKDPPLIPDQTNNTDTQLYDVFGRSFTLGLRMTFL